jgi:acyl-CoA thioester hydrolase
MNRKSGYRFSAKIMLNEKTRARSLQKMTPIITYRGTVFPWHCDHMGHMNIMHYVGKFDEANWNLFAALGVTPSYLRRGDRGMAGVQQNISYKRELLAGDVVEVRSFVQEMREKVVRFVHEMYNTETGEVASSCEITAVHLDRHLRKACEFSPEIRATAATLLAS